MILGVGAAGSAAPLLVSMFSNGVGVFGVMPLMMMLVFPLILAFSGWSFYKTYQVNHLAGCLGLSITGGAFLVSALLSEWFISMDGGDRLSWPYSQSVQFAVLALAVVGYTLLMKLFVAYFTGEQKRARDFLARWVALGMAYMLWIALSEIAGNLGDGISLISDFFLPIAVSYAVYYGVTRWAGLRGRPGKRKKKQSKLLELENP